MTQSSIHSHAVFDPAVAPPEGRVIFPEGRRPDQSPVFTRNELAIAAPAEQIWAWLLRARRWPQWYANAKNVEIEGGAHDLTLGSKFHWTTFGVRAHTVIEECVPHQRLAWSAKGLGASAYHGWVITPRASGCVVVTDETQQGIVPSVFRRFLDAGLSSWHQRWLEGLAEMAATGMP